MKRQFLRVFDHSIYYAQHFALGFLQGFGVVTMIQVVGIGACLVTASWLVKVFGEERTIAFIQNHPILFGCTALLFIAGTGGAAYWAYTRSGVGLQADLQSRLAKHSPLFKVA